MDAAHIRNFCIIAHIDHGKTTLSDRLLHRTGTISTRDMEDQLLDSMDLERERGITIKAHPVTMTYTAKNGEIFELNLIDTPGHVDFSYEVSRSLSACEGALLIIDAAQGVEAQTVANMHLAMKQNLTIIPIINKIDLPHANVAQTKQQLEDILTIDSSLASPASAKEGIGIEEILEAIVARIPSPKPTGQGNLQALAFDSYFDTYKGVVTHLRVFDGEVKPGMQVKLHHSGKSFEVKEVGSFNPKPQYPRKTGDWRDRLHHRQYQIASRCQNGRHDHRCPQPRARGAAGLQGNPSTGLQRHLSHQHRGLRAVEGVHVENLKLNDSAFVYTTETSVALGIRLPLRFSRTIAPGNRPGTIATRIQHGHHRHLSKRGL